ncbi:MAG TPA: alkaline phosphatase [Phenylobacterium sp.]
MTRTIRLAAAISLALTAPVGAQQLPQAADSYFQSAQRDLEARLAVQPRTGRARNVILFVGDGMGVSTVTAARIHQGQRRGADGESNRLAMEGLPYLALSRTFAHDAQVTDSAPSATAMVTGVKTRNDVIGLSSEAELNDCPGSRGRELVTAFAQAAGEGRSTGIVSTARIVHATPAAMFAATPNRDWEADADMPAEALAAGCRDIARQLVEWAPGGGFNVALGGGRTYFLPASVSDPEYANQRGRRRDGRDLTAEWLARYPNGGAYVWNAAQFDAVDPARTTNLLGLFEPSHMRYEADRARDGAGEPSLAQMTGRALDILSRNDRGYFLMVESGRIDHGHHENSAYAALEDTLAFDVAIEETLRRVNLDDTLVIVTADHSHVFNIAGYPRRNNPILGLVRGVDGELALARDNAPFTTLGYLNGPASVPAGQPRPNLSNVDTTARGFRQQTLVPLASETHGGEDVPIYAGGPMAHLFAGTVDQQFIYHVIARAAGLGTLR